MMIIDGFKLVSDEDNVYRVVDVREVVLGHIVRFYLHDGAKRFRAFGENFESLRTAVSEFGKIPHARKFPPTGDAFEVPEVEKVLR